MTTSPETNSLSGASKRSKPWEKFLFAEMRGFALKPPVVYPRSCRTSGKVVRECASQEER